MWVRLCFVCYQKEFLLFCRRIINKNQFIKENAFWNSWFNSMPKEAPTMRETKIKVKMQRRWQIMKRIQHRQKCFYVQHLLPSSQNPTKQRQANFSWQLTLEIITHFLMEILWKTIELIHQNFSELDLLNFSRHHLPKNM